MQLSLNYKYFDWLYNLVAVNQSYRRLLRCLHDIEFSYTIPMDGNRAEDGIDLRYHFGYENSYEDALIADYLDNQPCSVLEMMVAIAVRCEEHIMFNPDEGNRTSQWFWDMIDSLGLSDMTDDCFDEEFVTNKISRFLNHEYGRDGEGGLFTIKNCKYDLRTVEIWCQMNWYLEDYATEAML